MKLIVKTFQEITIKSRPVRKRFIRQLAKNIRAVLRDLDPEPVSYTHLGAASLTERRGELCVSPWSGP